MTRKPATKWDDETIHLTLIGFINELGIDRMPTSSELRENNMTGLMAAISKTGGVHFWSEKLGLKRKEKVTLWNDERIKNELNKSLNILQIKRMPSADELKSIGRNDLHCAISKSKKYRGWAEELGLSLKESDTSKGQEWEFYIGERLQRQGFDIKQMTTKHPFDILVNDAVKVDVKVGSAHTHFGTRCHTFRPSKKYATCDIYICVGLDEEEKVEKIFIIPSKLAQLVTLNICNDSKYNVFLDRWDYISRFVEFYEEVEM